MNEKNTSSFNRFDSNASMKRKTSEIWSLFRPVDDTFAVCSICKAKLSYRTTTTNLSKHLQRMHPTCDLPNNHSRYSFIPNKSYNQRGKHRNPAQEKRIAEFVKAHPLTLLKPTRENRKEFELLWDQLSAELNNLGPPEKDVSSWKRALKDWKIILTRKLQKSPFKSEGRPLNAAEQTLVRLWRLNEDISHIVKEASSEDDYIETSNDGHNSFDIDIDDMVIEDYYEDVQLDSPCEQEDSKITICIDPLSEKARKLNNKVALDLPADDVIEKINQKISAVNDATNKTQLALKEFCGLYKEKLLEDKRHHLAMEKILTEKNELKQKLLEIEQQKLLLR
ncbi:uncharacterized protein LOC115621291 [Scaptodrosophila lebanonensis]|uniref:Uncharacterized protein LOC115621291 n=1 Tax=Drosophila lebanonensis TaxID=7225 RepID=A0A6J2T6K1_DROLE|nr:uncharacterized protein LOC115621291 [Scaptodrosophila lebanonensis]